MDRADLKAVMKAAMLNTEDMEAAVYLWNLATAQAVEHIESRKAGYIRDDCSGGYVCRRLVEEIEEFKVVD